MDQAETLWPRDALPKGTVLNGYRIEAVIGRGGFGITYRATDAIDQVFAVKECFPKQFAVRQGIEVLPSDQDSAEPFADCLSRFDGEARALRHLGTIGAANDGVVKVSTFFSANGTAYVIMEYLAGNSLDRVIKSHQTGLPRTQLDVIVPHLLQATASVHEAGLLHRDIKPANIILREDGRPVLIDFGAARTSSQGRTVTYTQIFSENYAPIEQFAGARQGPFSDVYALGATLYRTIGGTTLDSFTRHQAILRGQRDPQIPAIQVGADRYDGRLLSAIDAAMLVAPEDRPQTVAALSALFADGLAGEGTVVVSRHLTPSQAADRPKPQDLGRMDAAPGPDPGPEPAAAPVRADQAKPRARVAVEVFAAVTVALAAGVTIYVTGMAIRNRIAAAPGPAPLPVHAAPVRLSPGPHYGVVQLPNIPVHIAPRDNAAVRAVLGRGARVVIESQTRIGAQGWLLIRGDGAAGWVRSGDVLQ